MDKKLLKVAIALCGLTSSWLVVMPGAFAQSNFPVQVKVYGQHIGSRVIYNYQVVNNSPNHVAAVRIGYDTQNDKNPDNDGPELRTFPPSWNRREFGSAMPPGTVTVPPGWEATAMSQEETLKRALTWSITYDNFQAVIKPGDTLGGMSVTLEAADDSYLNSHALVIYSDGYPKSLTVPIERLDTTAPALSVILTPAALWPPNEKPVTIAALITVKDDYDPAPDIKLESITANEPLEKGDIPDARIGTDDRQFKLKAEREGKNRTGRVYTVTYSATDASGNKATASATVTVPHDEREKDRDDNQERGITERKR